MEEEVKNDDVMEEKKEEEDVKNDEVMEEKEEKTAGEEVKEKPLDKMTAPELREIAKEIPGVDGVHAMKKEQLLQIIKEHRGIKDEEPAKKRKKAVKKGIDVKELKSKIVRLKEEKASAREGRDGKKVEILRRRINRLKKMTRKFRIERQVAFTGWADQKTIAAYFNRADLGLMPEPKNDYTDNSLHNKVLEYMSFGLPVLAYDLKELRLNAKKSAAYVKDDDEKRYAKVAVELLDNPELRRSMGSFGRKRIEHENFKWEASTEELLKAYEYLMVKKVEEGSAITA